MLWQERISALFEWAGIVAGAAIGPLFGIGSAVRGARLFHAEGVVYEGVATALDQAPTLSRMAARLEGPVLVRLSEALWRNKRESPDVLGITLRFAQRLGTVPARTDQDLMLATIPSIWALPVAPFVTDVHDYLHNDYYGLLPFTFGRLGLLRFRLRPIPPSGKQSGPMQQAAPRQRPKPREDSSLEDESERARLLAAKVAQGQARFILEASRGKTWMPVVEIKLLRPRPDLDQEKLRFSPFRSGRGIKPRGFINGLRLASYAFSQAGRAAVSSS